MNTKTLFVSLLGVLASILSLNSSQAQNLYVADSEIDVISPSNTVSTFSAFGSAESLAFNSMGDLFVARQYSDANISNAGYIYKIAPDGGARAFATNFPAGNVVTSLTVNSSGDLFAALRSSNGIGIIDEISPDGSVSTFASGLNGVFGMAINSSGNLFAASSNAIVEMTPDGTMSTFVTNSSTPVALTIDSSGNLFESFRSLHISEISTNGAVSDYGAPVHSLLNGLAVDLSGNLFAASITQSSIYKIAAATNGVVSTIASLRSPAALTFGPQTSIWSNGANFANMDTPQSWSGSTIPYNNSILAFGSSSSTNIYNNFTNGMPIAGINFTPSASSYTINGMANALPYQTNSLDLNGGFIVNESTKNQIIKTGLFLTSIQTITTSAGGGNITLDGLISGTGGLLVNGMGTLTITNNNTYTGGITVNSGTVDINNIIGEQALTVKGGTVNIIAPGNSISTPALTNALTINGGILDLGTNIVNTYFTPLTMTGGIIQNGTINPYGGKFTIQGGIISANFNGEGSLIKTSTSNLTIAGSGYIGGISYVNSGTLLIASSSTLSTYFTVNSGATLQNNGMIVGNTIENGALAGDEGIFTSLAFNGSSSLIWNVDDFNGTAGTNWDELNAQSLDFSNLSSTNPLTIDVEGISGAGNTNTSYSFNLMNVTGELSGFDPSKFVVNASLFNADPSLAGGIWSVGTNSVSGGTQLTLTYAVPEPSESFLFGLGLLGLLISCRKRWA